MITVEVTSRFKGLDLIDRVSEELWTEVCDIVQEEGIKTISKKKKTQKGKMVVLSSLTSSVATLCSMNLSLSSYLCLNMISPRDLST